MKALLAWAVLSLSIMAGFTARAADGVQMFWTKEGNLVCRYQSYKQPGDKVIPYHFWTNVEQCLNSTVYKNLKKANKNDGTPTYPKIDKYVKIFETKTGISVGITKIRLGSTKKGILGVCNMRTRQIIIDKAYWKSNRSELGKELTVYHELAHCVLNRAHFNDKVKMFNVGSQKKSCPLSIMYKSAWAPQDAYRCFHQNRDYYFQELRAGSFLLKSQKNGKDSKILQSWYLFHETFTIKVGPFSCTARRGTNIAIPKNNYIFHISSIKCTRDNVIFSEVWKTFKTSVGKNRVNNLIIKSQNRQALYLVLHDTLLNEKYTVYLMKTSWDLW